MSCNFFLLSIVSPYQQASLMMFVTRKGTASNEAIACSASAANYQAGWFL